MTQQKRLYLLSAAEIADLYARPIFDKEERYLYFAMDHAALEALNQFGTLRTKVYFMLQLAYFKAKNQFFVFEFDDVQADVQYILSQFFNNQTLKGCITRQRIRQQQQLILQLFSYQEWSEEQIHKIENHLYELLRYYPKVRDTFRQLLLYLNNQKIIIPTYRVLQDMLTQALAKESKRLAQLTESIPREWQEQLSALLKQQEGITKLNTLRYDQKNFKYTAIHDELNKALALAELYKFAKDFLPSLLLSKNAIRYYADLTEHYTASRLRKLNQPQQRLQMLCFAYHRYQQIMDNLITSFMYHTRLIIDEGKAYVDKAMAEYNAHLVVDIPKLARFLKWFPQRKPELNYEELNKMAYKILPEEQFIKLAHYLEGHTFDKKTALREFYLKTSRLYALYLRPILLVVPFVFYKENSKIMAFIDWLKNHYARGKSPATLHVPVDLIPQSMRSYLKKNAEDEHIDPYLFEFFVYQKMYRGLNKGLLCCNESVSYCDIDHDLVAEAVVDDIEKIAREFGYPKISIYCDQHLDKALKTLDETWDKTIKRIHLGQNAGFKITITKDGEQDWSLNYDSVDNLEMKFFKTLSSIEIPDVVMCIGDRINMWNSFSHFKTRYTKRRKPIALAVNACILSNAFGMSAEKMATMSDLNDNLLRATQEDFIRTDTLRLANDAISNLIHSLPIFKLWNLMDEKLLADADGQKLPSNENTIQSRYSQKYLGKSPGLSVYTLVANFVAINAKTIGLNEYEGHFLYDIVYGNKTTINVDMVTGDNHSLNKLNFVILDSISVNYVPGIKDIKAAADDLYSVKHPDFYKGLICSKGIIDKELIRAQKKGISRVLLSLLLQENTQSNIVRKINSYARYAGLKKALFEYNTLFKSIHILNLIDNMTLRKAIRAARNRTEAYHQLQGFIRKIYRGVFKGKTVISNQVSAHALRLVANTIIAYNSLILNTLYNKMLKEQVSQSMMDKFARISPIAWAHIAFTGKYNFKKSDGNINIDTMANILDKNLKLHFSKNS